MKRWISLSLLLSILAMLICVPAAAPAETKVTLNDDVSYSGGKTKISWRVSGDDASNYIVLIQAENGKASQQLMRVGETTSHSIKAVEMLPGKKYKVMVLDALYRTLAEKTYEMPEPEDLEDGKLTPKSIKVSVELRKMKHGGNKKKDTKKVSEFDSDEIIKGIEKGKKTVSPCALFALSKVLMGICPPVKTVYWKLEKNKLDRFKKKLAEEKK